MSGEERLSPEALHDELLSPGVAKHRQGQRSHRDSGYVTDLSVSVTPHFHLGSEAGEHEEGDTFTFDEEDNLSPCFPDEFADLDSTHGHHHPYDVTFPSPAEHDCGHEGSKPVDIPRSNGSHHCQRHDHFTPPRGYIAACHRYSTGSLPVLTRGSSPKTSAQSVVDQVDAQTEAAAMTQGREIVDNAIKFHEGLLQHTENRMIQKGQVQRRKRHISEGEKTERVEGAEKEESAAEGPSCIRGRSQSVPVMAKTDLEKLCGQELRRIADEFHCSNVCLEELYHAPSTSSHVRHHSASYPGRGGHQRGWWQHVIQFISPRRRQPTVTSRSARTTSCGDPLLETEIE